MPSGACRARRDPQLAPADPRPGVYEYRGSGTERLIAAAAVAEGGPHHPGVGGVARDGGCWRFRLDFSTNHWQDWTYCRHGNDVEERGGRSWQRWMIGPQAFTNLTTSAVRPRHDGGADTPHAGPGVARRGAPAPATRSRASVSLQGPYRFVADEDLKVGGTTVRAAHFLRTPDDDRGAAGHGAVRRVVRRRQRAAPPQPADHPGEDRHHRRVVHLHRGRPVRAGVAATPGARWRGRGERLPLVRRR